MFRYPMYFIKTHNAICRKSAIGLRSDFVPVEAGFTRAGFLEADHQIRMGGGAYTGRFFETQRSPEAVILSAAKDLWPATTQILRCAQSLPPEKRRDDTSLVPFLKNLPV